MTFITRLASATAVLVLAALITLGAAVTAPGGTASAASDPGIQVSIARVTPAVAEPGKPVRIEVVVTNNGTQPLDGIDVRALIGRRTLENRTAVAEFAAGTGPSPTIHQVATARIPGPVAPRARGETTLEITSGDVPSAGAFGVHPLVIEAVSGDKAIRTRSYLPVHTRKEYEPIQLAFAIPLTFDPDPQLVTATGEDLASAWGRLAGASGRITRILTGTDGRQVTFAVDPTLVGYNDQPPPELSDDDQGRDPATQVQRIITAVAGRLAAQASATIWELPPADPDLAALSGPDADQRLLQSITSTDTGLANLLDRAESGSAITRIAWPVSGSLGPAQRIAVDAAYAARDGEGADAFIARSGDLDASPLAPGQAARRTAGGSAMLVSDDILSADLASATSAADAGAATQRFLADAMTLLAESPGRARTVLVAAPRDFAPDAVALGALLDSAEDAPWLSVVSGDELIAAARRDTAPTAPEPGAAWTGGTGTTTTASASPLATQEISQIILAGQHVAGIGSVLTPTTTSTLVPHETTIQALASSRWRGQARAFAATSEAVYNRISTLTTGVSVLPSTVNFLADHGVMQVTAVNNLDVAVHNVRLVLEPQGQPPRLRITSPEPLSIAPRSRTTVRVSVEAVAAGVVPVSTRLTTATGTRLGTDATVNVRVQPTGGWIVAVGGVLAGVVFIVGLFRTLRRGRPRVTDADLEGIDLG